MRSFFLASSADFSHFFLSTSIYWKLGETWTVAYHIFIVIVFDVSVSTAFFLNVVFLVGFRFAAVLTSAVLDADLLSKTSIDFAAELIFGSWKLFLRWCSVSTLLATWLIACLKAGLKVLTVCISLVKFRICLSVVKVLLMLFLHATFFHLVFITVFILVVAFLEIMLSLSLHVSDSVFIEKWFYLAGGFGVIWDGSFSSGSLESVWTLSFFLFYFCYLFFVYFILVNMLFVFLRPSFYLDLVFHKWRRWEF